MTLAYCEAEVMREVRQLVEVLPDVVVAVLSSGPEPRFEANTVHEAITRLIDRQELDWTENRALKIHGGGFERDDAEHSANEASRAAKAEANLNALQGQVRALQQERDRWKANHDNAVQILREQKHSRQVEADKRGRYIANLRAESQADKARIEALKEYARHRWDCVCNQKDEPEASDCTCGLLNVLAASQPAICGWMLYTDEVLNGPRCVLLKGHTGFCSDVTQPAPEGKTQ